MTEHESLKPGEPKLAASPRRPVPLTLNFSSGGGDQHRPPRGPEAPVPQDQDGGRQHDLGRGHPPHPQRRVHGLPVPQHHRG